MRDLGYGRNGVEKIGLTHPKGGRITLAEHPNQARRRIASGVNTADHHNAQPAITRVAGV